MLQKLSVYSIDTEQQRRKQVETINLLIDAVNGSVNNSTSAVLLKNRAHYVTAGGTLPDLEAGEWVSIINNSGSDITITKASSSTTYWTAGQVSIATVTLQARGRMLAEGVGGSVVYVSGDISGYT